MKALKWFACVAVLVSGLTLTGCGNKEEAGAGGTEGGDTPAAADGSGDKGEEGEGEGEGS